MTLLFPMYLLGLLGLALPWLLHRFSDQQPDEQLFPSKRFLEETTPPVSRKRRLRYLILLAMRVLFLLLLCLLFAQPWLSRSGNAGPAMTHHMIAVDRSFSMRSEERWQLAMQRAESVIAELPEADSIELFGFDGSVTLHADDSESVSAIRSALSDMQPGFMAADYGRVMQALNTKAGEQEIPVKLWMISDQQRTSLPAQLNALYAPRVAAFEWLSVVDEEQFNIHLDASAQSADSVNVRVDVLLSASRSVTAAAPDADAAASLRNVTVQVSFDDQVLAEQTRQMGAGQRESVVFEQLVLPPGKNPQLLVTLVEEDALDEDNAVSLVVLEEDPTAIVYLQSDRDVSGNAPVFVSTAFETDAQARVEQLTGTAERVSPETPHIVTGRDLGGDDLPLDVLQFVDQGNNALVFDSREFRALDDTLLNAREVGLVDETHPLALGDIDWFGTRFFEVSPMALKDDDRVLIETTEREPILVERRVERGRVLILNDRLDGQGSNLPLQPAFVTLMQSLLQYFEASTAIPDRVIVGERISLPSNVQVLNPDTEPLLALDASGRSSALQLNEPGLYTVVGTRGEHVLHVLLDAKESDISTLDDSVMLNWESRYDQAAEERAQSPREGSVLADAVLLAQGKDTTRLALWQWLMPLLLIVMIIESWLGNRRLDVRRDGS